MTAAKWYPGVTLYIDPDAIMDYEMDFLSWLGTETLASASVQANGCVASITEQTPTMIKYRISAVTVGSSVRVRVVTSSGRQRDFTTKYRPVQQ
jgi:hypothetical protein